MLKPETIAIQQDLANYCLTGKPLTTTNVSIERLSHYRRLVYNVFYGILEQAYPITFNYLSKLECNSLVDDFVAKHTCSDPQVWKMPKDLIAFVENHSILKSHPYLSDLLKFEWMEIEVHCMADEQLPEFIAPTNLMHDTLFFNPYYQILQLTYPVHKINKVELLEQVGRYFVLAFRDNKGKVHFMSLDTPHAVILDSMLQNPGVTATDILEELKSETQNFDAQKMSTSTHDLLSKLVQKGFILGRPA